MNRSLLRALLVGGLLLSATACFKTTYKTQSAATGVTDDVWHNRLVFGMVELDGGDVRVDELCPQGEFAKIKTSVSLGNSLVNMIVNSFFGGLQLYTPSKVEVWCADGSAYRAEVDDQGVITHLEAAQAQAGASDELIE